MSENNHTLGAIIFKQRGKHRYYYYSRSHRVKLDPGTSGKTTLDFQTGLSETNEATISNLPKKHRKLC